jgi:hypothetical protein
MNIVRVDFSKFRNEEWFQLFTEFRDLVLKYNPDALNNTNVLKKYNYE